MAFVKVGVFNGGDDVEYVDPDKVSGYNVYKVAEDCYMARLYVGHSSHTLTNPDKDHQGWNSQEAALEAVEEWFRQGARVTEKLERAREEIAREPYRLPQVGDIYRIHDRYWFVTHVDVPSDAGVYNTYIALLMTEEERKPGGYNYTKTTSRMSTFFHAHAEWVGNTEPFMEAARQLLGSFYRGKGSLAYVLDGFTGREGMMVHYGLQGTDSTYCCHKKLPLEKGHVVTDNEHGVTCPQFDRSASYEPSSSEDVFDVVHYANARDNFTKCEATYPLPKGQTWTENWNNVDCPNCVRIASQQQEAEPWSKPCGSTKGHAPHTWEEEVFGEEGPRRRCTGLTFPTSPDPVNSGDDA